MADLFLSYTHQDVKRAEMLAELLEATGLTVWWDRRMIAGDKIHDVIDEEIEKAKAVIVLWSPISVKSDWVRGEAETAHELAKLVPIKIQECKLPINFRGIHTPEVYKSKAELNKLAQVLSDKFRTAQPLPRGATAEPTATKIEFTDESSADFLTKLSAQKGAYKKEGEEIYLRLGLRGELWPKRTLERLRLIKKYPLGAAGTGLTKLLFFIIMMVAAAPLMYALTAFDSIDSITIAVASAIVLALWFCIYTSYKRTTDERWITAAKRNIGLLWIFIFPILVINALCAFAVGGVTPPIFVVFAILSGVALIFASQYKEFYKGLDW